MDRTEKVELTNMCMVRRGNEVLVENRRDPDWSGITLPGGHVEKGESFTEAVIREVREETGLTITDPHLCGIKSWAFEESRYIVLLYRAHSFTGSLKSSAEGEVFWTRLDSLPALSLASGMEETFRLFMDDGFSELFYRKQGEDWTFELT